MEQIRKYTNVTLETESKKLEGFSSIVLDKYLNGLEKGYAEYMIIAPDEPVNGCSFIQICPDREEGKFHLEVSIVNENQNYLYGNEPYSIDEIGNIFRDYLDSGIVPDVDGWELIGKFIR
ncbi:MAG: hypothetical protein IJ861_04835 [Clostridia bacterium]|nr:hypothetical protein [Clostridia bacterium]